MSEAGGGGRALHLGLDPPARVEVEHVRVVEVDVSLLLAPVVVAAEVEDGGADEGGRVAAPRRGRNALDLGEGPEPVPVDPFNAPLRRAEVV